MEPISIGSKQLLVVGDRVLVEPETGEKTTEVGLILPANAVAKEAVQGGVVRAVGPGSPLPPPSAELEEEWQEPRQEPHYMPMQVKVGDHVTFFRKAAIEISVEGTNYLVVPQHAILVLMRDPAKEAGVPDQLPEEIGGVLSRSADLELVDLHSAHDRIREHIHRTPVVTCETLDRLTGCRLFLKCENFQKTGAFKFRGATNAVLSLADQEARRGVVTHSSGNHGASLARAAQVRGVPATVVMPENSPQVKQDAVRGYGAEIRFCQPTLEARESTAESVLQETGGTLIHPYNDERIICGQGTAALELLEQVPDLDAILTPVGGGGMLSGTLLATRSQKLQNPGFHVVGCEPEWADDAYRSWKSGSIQPVLRTDTVADGLRTALGDKTFAIIQKYVDAIATVSEETILEATWLIIERAKIVVEPSAAVTLGALLRGRLDLRGKKVGLMLTGGNVDLGSLRRSGTDV